MNIVREPWEMLDGQPCPFPWPGRPLGGAAPLGRGRPPGRLSGLRLRAGFQPNATPQQPARKLAGLLAALLLLVITSACAHRIAYQTSSAPALQPTLITMRRQILNAADAGDGNPVLNQLRARMAAEPFNVALRLELAAYYRKIGLPELEMEHLQLAVERFPESRAARMALAQALRAAGLPRRAAESLEDFARMYPRSADAEMLNLLGICHDEAEDFKAGEQAFRRALALAPRLDYLHNNLGYNVLEQHREVEAVAAFRQALKWNPDSILARNNLGVALARASLEDPRMTVADALAHFQNVVDTATAYNNVAAAMMEQNRYEESRRLLEAALGYNRSHAAALANLRIVAGLDGKPLELKPRRPTLWRPLAALRKVFIQTTEERR